MTRVLLCLSHSIEEHDQLELLHSLGFEVASIGGYIDPAHPHDPKRPPLAHIPAVPEIRAAVDALDTPDNLAAAQARLPDAALDWADVVIYHHYLERLWGQWDRIEAWRAADSARRVIWRTVGQSGDANEREAQPYRARGLEIVRYSPNERHIPGFAGEDALIRFWKDPAEWGPWSGDVETVLNVTQGLAQRDPWTNWGFWEAATKGLPRTPVGPGSREIGGTGEVRYDVMKAWLRKARCYLYTGTQPASYTLGLIEAMMTGIPVVSIGPSWMRLFAYGPQLFEGHELVTQSGVVCDDPSLAHDLLAALLKDLQLAAGWSRNARQRAIELFGREAVGRQWAAFLGAPVREAVPA